MGNMAKRHSIHTVGVASSKLASPTILTKSNLINSRYLKSKSERFRKEPFSFLRHIHPPCIFAEQAHLACCVCALPSRYVSRHIGAAQCNAAEVFSLY
jgi:hypothetical protein